MSEAAGNPREAAGQLERDAARWCAIMHGPGAEQHKAEFEAWLRRGALHRQAYNRMDEVFLLGAKLPPRLLADNVSPNAPRQKKWTVAALAASLLGLCALPLLRGSGGQEEAVIDLVGHNVQLRLSTMRLSSEAFRLADGSVVTLSPDSEVAVDYNDRTRRLRLARGRSRFDVAPQPRPFLVQAGAGTVTARGTSFDVTLLDAQAFRVLVRTGSVDVAPPPAGSAAARQPRHLSAGEERTFAAGPDGQVATLSDASGTQPGTVGDLVAASNRLAGDGPTIRISDPSLLEVRLGGEFRAHAPAVVAERLALMLNLKLRQERGRIILERRTG